MDGTIKVVVENDDLVRKGDRIAQIVMGILTHREAGIKDIGKPASNYMQVIRKWTAHDRVTDLLELNAKKELESFDLGDLLVARCTQLMYKNKWLNGLVQSVGGLKWLDMRTEQIPQDGGVLFVYNAKDNEPELVRGSRNLDQDELFNEGYSHFMIITIPPLDKKAE